MGISLSKGQAVSLVKDNGQALSQVRLGLGWDEVSAPAKKGLFGRLTGGGGGGEIDLDASALLLDAQGRVLDVVFYGQLNSKDGSIGHLGDNLTGAGAGDDESINVSLDRVAADVANIVFVITSYSGHTFDNVANAFVRVLDGSSAREVEVARYDLTSSGPRTAQVVAKLQRVGAGWSFVAIGDLADGKTPHDLKGVVARYAS